MNNFLIENELGYTNYTNGRYVTEHNATHNILNDNDKLSIWKEKFEYVIPFEKEMALDELFGEK
jgi:hypothetical protein